MSRRAMTFALAITMLGGAGGPAVAQGFEPDVAGIGGRVEVVDSGYALTVPDEWVYVFPTAADASVILEAAGEFAPELSSTIANALAQGVGFSLLILGDVDVERGFTENCNVIDSQAQGISLAMVAAAEAAAAEGFGDLLASSPQITMLQLPAGEAARVDYSLAFPQFETLHAVYYFIDEPDVYSLTCTALERPDDDWLSIAETFEFLPADESAEADEADEADESAEADEADESVEADE